LRRRGRTCCRNGRLQYTVGGFFFRVGRLFGKQHIVVEYIEQWAWRFFRKQFQQLQFVWREFV
jgi:hypothetical protein